MINETEFGYIKWIQKHLKYSPEVLIGSGDDCAVLKINDSFLSATTDTIVEGIDFTNASPEQIGYKSVAVSLSDLAAMGGGFERLYALITVAIPKRFTKPSFSHRLFKGMHLISKRFGVQIIGGDISSTKGPITITSTLLGIGKSNPITRSGARVGDAILVTGRLGGSILGKHLSFTPRLKEAELLNHHYKITAMIDISDGLLADLNHILEASKGGAVLDELSIPISSDAYKSSKTTNNPHISPFTKGGLRVILRNVADKKSGFFHALTDGEDFELLFTAPMEEAVKIIHDNTFKKLPITIIGLIQKQKGIQLCNRNGKLVKIKPEGFRHF